MQTRSQSKQSVMVQSIVPVKSTVVLSDYSTRSKQYNSNEIDFDDASKCWMKNKTKLGNGTYKYKTPSKSHASSFTSVKQSAEGITTRSGRVLVF